MKRVRVIDYNAGNLFNVVRACQYLGFDAKLAARPEEIDDGDYLILPGVGAFGDGIASLKERGLIEPINKWVETQRPFLGICLGMQLLLSTSDEFGFHQGLAIIPGKVSRLPTKPGLKIPNIGWQPLHPTENTELNHWRATILEDMTPDWDMYFVHSYAAYPDNLQHWLARTAYSDHWFCSVLRKDNVYGCQFHPEKSGEIGLKVLKKFLTI